MRVYEEDLEKNLEEIFEMMLYNLSPKDLEAFKDSSKRNLERLHFTYALWIYDEILEKNRRFCMQMRRAEGCQNWKEISELVVELFSEYVQNKAIVTNLKDERAHE